MTDDSIWRAFSPFQSVNFAQAYLKNCYEDNHVEDALAKSYKNSYPLSYYLDYGKKYYHQAKLAPTELKPVLLFYGMVQLLKACLLTVHPNYPENADVLAHGVSSRKRKKQDYSFFDDQITIQKKGLFSLVAQKVYGLDPLEGKKYSMESLLVRIPELSPLFQRMKNKKVMTVVQITEGKLHIKTQILDELHMTPHRFEAFINQHSNHKFTLVNSNEDEMAFTSIDESGVLHPFLMDSRGRVYLPHSKESFEPLSEELVHYLLLYNLSMISRYETEWWNDLFHQKSSFDLPFIDEFLAITESKGPQMIFKHLQERERITQ